MTLVSSGEMPPESLGLLANLPEWFVLGRVKRRLLAIFAKHETKQRVDSRRFSAPHAQTGDSLSNCMIAAICSVRLNLVRQVVYSGEAAHRTFDRLTWLAYSQA